MDRSFLKLLAHKRVKFRRLLQSLQIRHQVMNVGIGVLAELFCVSLHGGVDFVLHVASAPGSISITGIRERNRELIEVRQSAGDGFARSKGYGDF